MSESLKRRDAPHYTEKQLIGNHGIVRTPLFAYPPQYQQLVLKIGRLPQKERMTNVSQGTYIQTLVITPSLNWNDPPVLGYNIFLENQNHQGIVGCTPTNVPLWNFVGNTMKYHGYTVRGTPPSSLETNRGFAALGILLPLG